MDTLHTSHPTTIFKTRWKFGEQGFQLALSSCRLDMLGTVFKLWPSALPAHVQWKSKMFLPKINLWL